VTLLLRAAGVTVLGLAVVACSGGDVSDEAAIKNTFQDFFAAFEDGDDGALAGLLSESCEDRQRTALRAIETLRSQLTGDVAFDVTGVDIRDLTATTAEVMPVGTYRFGDDEGSLSSEGDEFATLVKEDDGWKLADCNILFGF
jgi:hypothetical protein